MMVTYNEGWDRISWGPPVNRYSVYYRHTLDPSNYKLPIAAWPCRRTPAALWIIARGLAEKTSIEQHFPGVCAFVVCWFLGNLFFASREWNLRNWSNQFFSFSNKWTLVKMISEDQSTFFLFHCLKDSGIANPLFEELKITNQIARKNSESLVRNFLFFPFSNLISSLAKFHFVPKSMHRLKNSRVADIYCTKRKIPEWLIGNFFLFEFNFFVEKILFYS